VAVDPDPIYVRDGSCYTSAGVTAGIDRPALIFASHWWKKILAGLWLFELHR
jgi:transcriptional regulator GlxA family with amidase domain